MVPTVAALDEAQLRSRLRWTADECLKHLEEFVEEMELLRRDFKRSVPGDAVNP
jgi:hypothetical protein